MRVRFPLGYEDNNPLYPYMLPVGASTRGRRMSVITQADLAADFTFVDVHGKPAEFNGRDANQNRITNLVGVRGGTLIKRCPMCGLHKPILDFGTDGRPDGHHTTRRDQSDCDACRGVYT